MKLGRHAGKAEIKYCISIRNCGIWDFHIPLAAPLPHQLLPIQHFVATPDNKLMHKFVNDLQHNLMKNIWDQSPS